MLKDKYVAREACTTSEKQVRCGCTMETANVLLNNTQAFNRNCTAILDVHLPAFTYLLNPGAHVFIPVFRVVSDFSS